MSAKKISQITRQEISSTEEEVDELFQQFFSAYLNAASTVGETTDVYLRIARQIVLVKFAGKDAAKTLTRALSHVQIPPASAPDFTIYIWDSKSSGQSLPPFLDQLTRAIIRAPGAGLCSTRGDVPLLSSKEIRAAFVGSTTLTMAKISENKCVYWMADAGKIPYHDAGAALRVPFSLMFGNSSRQFIHGGAVGNERDGVFLGGIGGSGKSTTALNCLSSGLSYLSDDYVMVDLKPQPTAFSLYNTVKVKTMADLERFPQFRPWISNEQGVRNEQEKPMIFLDEHLPQKLLGEIPLKAIVFPKFRTGAAIDCQPMSQQCAFREIVTSTLRQTPNDDRMAIPMIGQFIKALPCYELIFGEDQKDVPKHIVEIIDRNSR